jgi:hypothetical protein
MGRAGLHVRSALSGVCPEGSSLYVYPVSSRLR